MKLMKKKLQIDELDQWLENIDKLNAKIQILKTKYKIKNSGEKHVLHN